MRFAAAAPSASHPIEIGSCRVADLDPDSWDDAFARARAPHPHYSRHALTAHRHAGLLPADVALVTVHRASRLEALMPYRLARDLSGLGGQVARPFLSPLVTATAPLVADAAPTVLDALVAGLAAASGGRAWRWPLLPVDHADGLIAAMARAGWSQGIVAEFERPVLDRRPSHADFLAVHPNKARLKDLRRRAKRLGEAGTLRLETATAGPELAAAVEEFLELESAGWKGAAGTAMACRPETAALARALFSDPGGPVSARADSLTLDGAPLAISLALVGNGTATLLKTAYDESRRALAPGLVLEAEIVRATHETPFADRLDSATLAGSALESLYPGRQRIAEIIALPPGADILSPDRRIRLARFEIRAREAAKRALKRR